MSVVALSDVVKRYETGGQTVDALAGVSMSVDSGEIVAVVGPSGSGKSTLLNMVGLLDTPTEGVVELDGDDATDLSAGERTDRRRSTIGFIFQSYHLLPTMNAVENVRVPALWDRSVDRSERARALLDRVGLGDRLAHRPDELSGGQRQRVAIARALVNEPSVVLADEPTGNLDRETGDTILAELRRLTDEEDVAIVAVTHDEHVTTYADRTVELVDGEIR